LGRGLKRHDGHDDDHHGVVEGFKALLIHQGIPRKLFFIVCGQYGRLEYGRKVDVIKYT
jgi:hypothetical protein